MDRGKLIVLTIVVILGLSIYFTLPEQKYEEKRPVEAFFSRTLGSLIQPPASALRAGEGNRLQRFLDRIEWGTSQAVNGAISYLADQKERPYLEALHQRVASYSATHPALAKRYIDLVAELGESASLDFLIDYTDSPSEMIKTAALKAVARFGDRSASFCLLRHARAEAPASRNLALDLLEDRGDPEVLAFFTACLEEDDRQALPFAIRALGETVDEKLKPLLRVYLDDADYPLHVQAMQVLIQQGDPAALAKLDEALRSPGPVIRATAVQSLIYSSSLPSRELLLLLTNHQEGKTRLLLASSLSSLAEGIESENKPLLIETLTQLKKDARPEVRLKALEGLYRAGDREALLPILRRLQEDFGGSLREAVVLTTEFLKLKDQVGPILIARFRDDPGLSPKDRGILLDGLSALEYSPATDLFFEVIKGAWQGKDEAQSPMSLRFQAAYKVHNLGNVLDQWLSCWNYEPSDQLAVFIINSARSMEDPGAAEWLLSLASEENRPVWIRREALLSFPFLRQITLGDQLLQYACREKDRELADCAFKVYWNYF